MIWPVLKLLAELSSFIALAPGDLVEASVTNLPPLSFTIQ